MMATWITRSLLLLSCFTLPSGYSIKRRGLIEFHTMFEAVTGKVATDFTNYGNYCGLGGSGIPVDAIDKCCMEHDACYDRAEPACLSSPGIYFSFYKWNYNGHDIICGNNNLCGKKLCHCDKKAVLCFAKNMADYNPHHMTFVGRLFKAIIG